MLIMQMIGEMQVLFLMKMQMMDEMQMLKMQMRWMQMLMMQMMVVMQVLPLPLSSGGHELLSQLLEYNPDR